MSYTSRYSGSYSSRYADSGRDSSSRYGGYSSRYSTGKDLTGGDEYSSPRESKYASSYRTKAYNTLDDADDQKKSEGDSSSDYTSSRYSKYSSRYTTGKDEVGDDDSIGARESKYSSSYRSKYRDTSDDVDETRKPSADIYEHDYSEKSPEKTKAQKVLEQEPEGEEELEYQADPEQASEDVEEYGGYGEDTAVREDDVEQIGGGEEETTIRSHTSSVSSSALADNRGAQTEEKPRRQVEHKVSFRSSIDNSEDRTPKKPVTNIVPTKHVSDLIARFNTGNVTNGRSGTIKESGGKPVGKLQSSVFH
ncbi:hypothetical protein GCK32_000123 [Trichostrongylus colubriformis]|uniref:Uncharacterized protein n=1 Tax=Trichostrongylus colubriformis TaxID=6319 RepID=A0AAN8FSL7_TRICO